MKTIEVNKEKYLLDSKMATAIGEFFGEKLTTGEWDVFEVHTENDLVHAGFKVIGCTKPLPGVELMEECPVCDGKGEAYFSCCGGDVVDSDMPICPSCKEHLGESDCEDCSGTGLVKKKEKRKKVIKIDLIGQAENAAEAKRDWVAETYPTGPAWTGD